MTDLAEEFLEDGWATYALVELKSLDDDEGIDGADRLDRLTRVLQRGSTTQKEEAQKLLRSWLQKKSSANHPLARKLRLRRAFILKKLRQFDSAIIEVKQLLEADPESPTLNCLLGNLYGWLGNSEGWKMSLAYFDKAIDRQDDWWEPRFERMDKMFLLGVNELAYWQQIVEFTQNWMHRSLVMTERERLIVWVYSAVASVLVDDRFIESDRFAKLQKEANAIVIPSEQLEDWDIEEIYSRAVRVRYAGDDERPKFIRSELWKLMGDAQKKLMPNKDWLPL